jgi:hypothetical protein
MNIVPLISIRNGKLLDGKDGNLISLDDLFKRVEKDSMLYVLDYDGLEHNNPNLELYQRLTEHNVLWIDDGPRRLDDVMDTIMSGATNITLREDLWPEMDLPGVFELTDDEVYITIDTTQRQQPVLFPSLPQDLGAVIFGQEPHSNEDFTSASLLKDLAGKHKIYLYMTTQTTLASWEERGIVGLLLDLNKTEGKHDGV